jgi:hypothetical protein
VALKADEERFSSEDAIKLGCPLKGHGLIASVRSRGQVIRRNLELQILRTKEDKRPPWAGPEGRGRKHAKKLGVVPNR